MEHDYMSSDDSSEDSCSSEESTRLEECHINGVRLQLPAGLCENKDIFNQLFSLETWQECFSEQQKHHLMNFLPSFPENENHEKEETLKRLFLRENIRFGSPLSDFHTHLKNGYFRPDIAKMRSLMRKALARDNKQRLKCYYSRLVKDVLVSRQRLLERSYNQPPGVVPKMERIPQPTMARVPLSEQRTKRRYFQELAAIRQEIGESDHSSEDENYPEGPLPRVSKKQKRHLSMLECSLSPNIRPVTSTLSLKSSGLDLEANVTPTSNPYDMTDETYKLALINHKKRRNVRDDHPELNTLGITMQEVIQRAQIGKKPQPSKSSTETKSSSKKTKKTEAATSAKPAVFVSQPLVQQVANSPQIPQDSSGSEMGDSDEDERAATLLANMALGNNHATLPPAYSLPVKTPVTTPSKPALVTPPAKAAAPRKRASSNTTPRSSKASGKKEPQKKIKIEPEDEADSYTMAAPLAVRYEQTEGSYTKRHQAATLSDLDGIDMMNLPIDLDETHVDMDHIEDVKPTPELMQETHACFFSLIRDVICSTSEHRMNLATMEDRLKAWQENPISPLNDWYCLANEWVAQLLSAIMFLCGDYSDAQPDDYVPYVEYKPQSQAYQWIGAGRDSDSHLQPLCDHWLLHRDEMVSRPIKQEVDGDGEESDGLGEERAVSPPPPRCPTAWAVCATSADEKELFREQEARRYDNPHRAFTFRMHGYESVVGPVKGVYNQTIGITKPRGHSLLVADRPNFVTILCLVRDATARLPNGEGTRTDICQLLKDSQYLAEIDQESYLHSVVSGALDRLHYETDPCVRYDTKRKIWIYLHRGRTEEEFERLHQQFQGVAKTKKSPNHRKPARPKKESGKTPASSPVAKDASVAVLAPHHQPVKQEVVVSTPTPPPPATVPTPSPMLQPQPKTIAVRAPRPVATVGKTFSQNLQVSTASGLQTIQVTTPPTLITGGVPTKPAPSVTQANAQVPVASKSLVKTVMVTAQTQSSATTTAATTTMKTVMLSAQQFQAARNAAAAKKAISAVGGKPAPNTQTIRMPVSVSGTMVGNVTANITSTTQAGPRMILTNRSLASPVAGQNKTIVQSASSSIGLVGLQQKTVQLNKPSILQQKTVAVSGGKVTTVTAGLNAVIHKTMAQTITVSQAQFVATPKPVVSLAGKAGVKLVNTVKAVATTANLTQQQTLVLKQKQQKQLQLQLQQQLLQQQQLLVQQQKASEPTTNLVTQQQQQIILQQQAKASAIAQIQQLKLQQQLQQQQQQQLVVSAPQQRVMTTVSVLNQGQARVVNRGGVQAAVAGGGKGAAGVKVQSPLIGKVLTNMQGQVISMESLLAHQKQHGTLPQGTALRVATAGSKPGQTSLIQIPSTTPGGVTQYAVVSQGNILSVGQPRVLHTHIGGQQTQVNASNISHQTLTIQQTQGGKLINAATGKPIVTNAGNIRMVAATSTANANMRVLPGTTANVRTTGNLRMLNPGGGGLNLATIGGKPVLLASKGQASAGNIGGQNVYLTTQAGGQGQTVVLASQAMRAQGGHLVLQQGGAQQILLPPGFQGGTLNIKTLQGLQGLKVIPLAQAGGAKGRQQVYARIINPGIRPTMMAGLLQQQAATATIQQNQTIVAETSSANVIQPKEKTDQ